jgi:hypothetical protein
MLKSRQLVLPLLSGRASRVTLADLLRVIAAQEGHKCPLFPAAWRLVYWLLKAAKFMSLHLPFRAVSLLGLINSVYLNGVENPTNLGVILRPFTIEHAKTRADERVL